MNLKAVLRQWFECGNRVAVAAAVDHRDESPNAAIRGRRRSVGSVLFPVPEIGEELARAVDPGRLIRPDYIMVQRPSREPA
jgi:hypothetical protein